MKTIYVESQSLAEGWENAVLRTWNEGCSFKTEYDKPGDPESKDVTLMLHVKNPFSEPRIHRGFPGGLDDLEKYVMEVIYGVHDHWIAPEEGKWEYTYHERLFGYKVPEYSAEANNYNPYAVKVIDQIASVIEKLKQAPHTRRAQAVTWQAWNDIGISDPACLQRLWFRCENVVCPNCQGKGAIPFGMCSRCDTTGTVEKLNMHVHIRSNDAYKAGFMNIYAFTELQKWVAEQIGVEVGEYVHIADSFHIYGSYFNEFEGFLKMVENRKFEERTWTASFAIPMFIDGCDEILKEIDLPNDKRIIVEQRKEYLESLQ